MSHFEIAVTVYSVLSTIGLGLTVYFGRKFLLGIEARLFDVVHKEAFNLYQQIQGEASHIRSHVRAVGMSAESHVITSRDTLKADIARVEKWITDHAEELKARAEDLRVRALDLHDKTAASDTRQPPVR